MLIFSIIILLLWLDLALWEGCPLTLLSLLLSCLLNRLVCATPDSRLLLLQTQHVFQYPSSIPGILSMFTDLSQTVQCCLNAFLDCNGLLGVEF